LIGKAPTPGTTDLFGAIADLPDVPTLLVLDDVDPAHLECVGLAQRLLLAAPKLQLLVTCRRPLGLGEECVFRLTPLSCVPPRDHAGPSAAAELFLARAHDASAAEFRPKERELQAIEQVCQLLEGVPLAIELAAQQLATHRLGDLPGLLEHNQSWLASADQEVPRHRSLREAVGADYLLCEEAVRAVWRRVSVLVGPFAESTAAYVCEGGGILPEQVPFGLTRLVSSGVVQRLGDVGGVRAPRYRMTRAARDFGMEQLVKAGEFPVTAERRMIHCRQTAAVAENLWNMGCQRQAVELVADLHADFQAAVRHAITHREHVERAVEGVAGLWFWWMVYGHVEEGRSALLALLPLCPSDSPVLVRNWWLAAWLSVDDDPQRAGQLLARAWQAAILAGDDATIGRVSYVQGELAWRQLDARTAATHYSQAADTIPNRAPGGPSPAVSLAALAVAQIAIARRDARRSARRALTDPSVRSDAWATTLARYAQACIDHHDGHPRRAARRARRTLDALDPTLPAAQGTAALRQLINDVEEQARPPRQHPRLPAPRVGTPLSAQATGRSDPAPLPSYRKPGGVNDRVIPGAEFT
jgi:predicted ATPase